MIKTRAEMSIAQGALTNSKRPESFIKGVYPTHFMFGAGASLYTQENRRYLDYCGGLGANLFGYGNIEIANAVFSGFTRGPCMSFSSHLEVELAETLKELFRFVDLWKFTKTGTEACNASLKIARAYTGRTLVLSEGYHGWNDEFVSLTPPALGVPAQSNIKLLKDNWELIKEAAAVIVEPVITDWSNERAEFLRKLREECSKHGTVLIFDEIITGFRFKKFGVCNYFGIDPDLVLLGKALGGGAPIAAIGGKKDLMSGEYFVSGTYFGELGSICAALKVISLLRMANTRYSIDDLWNSGQHFLDQFNTLDPDVQIKGYPTRGAFSGDQLKKALFWQEACKAFILFGNSWFFNFALPSRTDETMAVCRDIFSKINCGSVILEGEMPSSPFAQRSRNNE